MRGFVGGQMPLHRRLPKRGFTNIFKREWAEVNLVDLEKMFDAGASVTPEALLERGLIRKSALKSIVILGQGELKKSLTVNAHRFSKSAKQKIEAAGGKAELIEDRGSRIEDRG
jgi:large subunit ribosomal protein L15